MGARNISDDGGGIRRGLGSRVRYGRFLEGHEVGGRGGRCLIAVGVATIGVVNGVYSRIEEHSSSGCGIVIDLGVKRKFRSSMFGSITAQLKSRFLHSD